MIHGTTVKNSELDIAHINSIIYIYILSMFFHLHHLHSLPSINLFTRYIYIYRYKYTIIHMYVLSDFS